jgi:nucleotide-binding universal stress UspA family protein
LREATLRPSRVRVVHAWLPTAYSVGTWAVSPAPHAVENDIATKREAALADFREHVLAARYRENAGDVPVDVVGVEGVPDEVLVEQARDADLLVVGTRGHGQLASLVLGSVSRACAQHATCPVTIVPPQPIDASRARVMPPAETVGAR